MSQMGLVSRVTPVHTANATVREMEEGPFGFGNQVLISSHRKLLSARTPPGEGNEREGSALGGPPERVFLSRRGL
jgi:hypothetical protein